GVGEQESKEHGYKPQRHLEAAEAIGPILAVGSGDRRNREASNPSPREQSLQPRLETKWGGLTTTSSQGGTPGTGFGDSWLPRIRPEGRCNFVVLPRAEKEALASEQHTPGIAVLVIPLELEHHPVGMLGHGHGLQPLHK